MEIPERDDEVFAMVHCAKTQSAIATMQRYRFLDKCHEEIGVLHSETEPKIAESSL